MSKRPSISIVIPAYNEAGQILRCLQAIEAQTVHPKEVIVVDNGSTDDTAALAARVPFVRVMYEPKRGVMYARDRGFEAARGDIIGRIDADTLVNPDWVATLQQIFSNTDTDAVSGSVTYYAVSLSPLLGYVDKLMRRYLSFVLREEVTLQGANMALRRDAWRQVKGQVCCATDVHEDFDLSIHLREAGYKNLFDPSLRVSVALRQATNGWWRFARYVVACPVTYMKHRRVKSLHILLIALLVVLVYPILYVLHAGYDEEAGIFSVMRLFGEQIQTRVSPVSVTD